MRQIMVTQPAEETEQGDMSMHPIKEQAKIKEKLSKAMTFLMISCFSLWSVLF